MSMFMGKGAWRRWFQVSRVRLCFSVNGAAAATEGDGDPGRAGRHAGWWNAAINYYDY
jgi:hypothetical protein